MWLLRFLPEQLLIRDMIEIKYVMAHDQVASLIEMLEQHALSLMELDVSRYARGRTRCWLRHEPELTSDRKLPIHVRRIPDHGELESMVWDTFDLAGFKPDAALCVKGPVGISAHRDGSYAATTAFGINLGRVDWRYGRDRGNGPMDRIEIPVGAVYSFDCKRLHSAEPIDRDRWSINGWNWAEKREFIWE